MFNSLRPHESQHARPPCPSPTPGLHPNPCPLSWWCHPTISSSVVHFSSRLQSFPASGSFPVSQFFTSGSQSTGVSASTSVLPKNTQGWSPLGRSNQSILKVTVSTTIQSYILWVQFSSVTQLCLTPCDPLDCSTPGLPVHHELLELAQTHVYWVGDAIQPSHPLLSPSPPAFNLSQHQGLFKWVSSYQRTGQSIEVSASASVLPVNIQDWFL